MKDICPGCRLWAKFVIQDLADIFFLIIAFLQSTQDT
jgi:hypothetical protein